VTFSVAFVGLGPKGLYALDSLVDLVARSGIGPIAVDVYEPHHVPGAGPVYDPAQPAYLRMNYSADQIDIWRVDERRPRRLPFVGWWEVNHGAKPSAFPPRSDVGRYLSDGFHRVCDQVPAGMSLRVVEGHGRSVRRQGLRWEVESAVGTDLDPERRLYDEVLIATGHDRRWAGELAATWDHRVPLVASVFPTTSSLAESRVPPGSTVGVRGFGLTFIDAALALTEGRGGRFERTPRLDRLRYVRSGREPLSILPFSRSGRTMQAKPNPGRFVNMEPLVAPYERRLRSATPRPDLDADVLSAVVGLAADLYAKDSEMTPGKARGLRDSLHTHLGTLLSGWTPPGMSRPAVLAERDLRRSVAVGIGLSRIDGAAALGESWRSLYPAIVATLGRGGLLTRDRPRFLRVAGEMERLSFGPPCENAMRLISLIEAGVVDLSHVAGGSIQSDRHGARVVSSTGSTAVDVVVDAVLPPPGVPDGGVGVTHQMVRDGYARVVSGGRGIDVFSDATCIGTDGMPSLGLSVVGRPTEDAVIGNDTLSRRLHRQPERWADRVAARARAVSRASAGVRT
jgi:diaminopimelate decarboxylase